MMLVAMDEVTWDEGGAGHEECGCARAFQKAMFSFEYGSLVLYALICLVSPSRGALNRIQASQTPTLNAKS
jgi:hypothetical protein